MTNDLVPAPDVLPPATLSLYDLATEINQCHLACKSAARSMVEHALRAGEYLIQAKEQCAHGEWQDWLEANCHFAARTARAYMQLAAKYPALDEAKRQRVANMPLREAMRLIAPPKEEQPAHDRYLPELVPPEGHGLIAELDHIDLLAFIWPSEHAGYFHVMVMLGTTDVFGGAMVEGTKRPVKAEALANIFDNISIKFPYDTVAWSAFPTTYRESFLGDPEPEWRRRAMNK